MSEFHLAFHQKAMELIPDFLYSQIKSAAIPISGGTTRWKLSAPSIFEKIAIPYLKPDRLKGLQPKELKDVLKRLNKIYQTAKRTKEDTSSFVKASNWVVQEMRERNISVDAKLAVIQEFIGKSDDEIEKTLQAEVAQESPKNPRGYTSAETLEFVAADGKFTKEAANYVNRAEYGYSSCTSCRFFMRDSSINGTCQSVEENIAWQAGCDLYIAANLEARFMFYLASAQIQSFMMDQALNMNKASEGGTDDDNNTDSKKPEMEIVKAKIQKRIKAKGNKFIVTDDSGEKVLGTHDNRADAIRQLAAIESSKLKKDDVEKAQPTIAQVHQPGSDKKDKDKDKEDDAEVEKDDIQFYVPIAKIDRKKQKIYGIVLEPEVTDTQDDTMSVDEIEKTAEGFMSKSRRIGLRHRQLAEGVTLTDNYVTQGPAKLGKQNLAVGTWIIGVKVNNPTLWAGIEKGEYNGFSVGGHGKRGKNVQSNKKSD